MFRIVEIDISRDFTVKDDIIKCIHYEMTPNRRNFQTSCAWPEGDKFCIGSWQTGDFPHLYAAVADNCENGKRCTILVLRATGFPIKQLQNDWESVLSTVAQPDGCNVDVFVTSEVKKDAMISVYTELTAKPPGIFKSPYDATMLAERAVKNMTMGQPLTPVWAEITRGKTSPDRANYEQAMIAFSKQFFKKMGKAFVSKKSKFVCVWGRTSGMRISDKRPLGGANPQYDSSEFGNYRLCKALQDIPGLTAILTVGDGFNTDALYLPHVFNLGEFWSELRSTKGRFKENGFFDYMTAICGCDFVHVGMKSGGMDSLALWGQKVVFVEYEDAPTVLKKRVGAWSSGNLKPVFVKELPTTTGQAIQYLRKQKGERYIKTQLDKKQWKAVDEIEDQFVDGFLLSDLEKIKQEVRQMFSP